MLHAVGVPSALFTGGSSLSSISSAAQQAALAAITRLPGAAAAAGAGPAARGPAAWPGSAGAGARDTPTSSLFTASPGLDLDDTLLMQELEALGLGASSSSSAEGSPAVGRARGDAADDMSLSSIQELVSLGGWASQQPSLSTPVNTPGALLHTQAAFMNR